MQKPQTTLYEAAVRDLDIDVHSSFVVGDSIGDMRAVKTSWRVDDAVTNAAVHVADDVLGAARWIVRLASEPF